MSLERATTNLNLLYCYGTTYAVGCVYCGFLWFLHVSELTPNLRWSNVIISSKQMSITLNQSKTDPFHCGQTIQLFPTGSSTCPIKALITYRGYSRYVDTTHNTPIFRAGKFNPLTQRQLNAVLRHLLQQAGFNHINYASHSFRIGAATTAAAAGLPPWLIKTLRRWHSDAYLTYIRCPDSVFSAVPQMLAKTDAGDPDL